MSRRPPPSIGRSDFDLLDEFVAAADELASTRLIQRGFETGLVIRGGGSPAWNVEVPLPDEDDFRSMLMAVRPFVSQGEELHFGRIYNILERRLIDPELRDAARASRETLRAAGQGEDFRIVEKSPAEIADLYLKGRYFHRDQDKRETLEDLTPESEKLFRYFLNQYSLEAVRQVAATSNIIRRARIDGLLMTEGSEGPALASDELQ